MNHDTLPVAGTADDMVRLFEAGVCRYQPAFANLTLRPEDGDPGVSIENLDAIVTSAPERSIQAVVAGPSGNLLIVLATGERYLVTGMGLGSKGRMDALAFYLANIEQHGFVRDIRTLFRALAALPAGFQGPLPLPLAET